MNRPRRSFSEAVRVRAGNGDWRWLWRAADQTLRLRLGIPRGPLYATLALTYRCNYRCFHCDLPERPDPVPDARALIHRLQSLAERGILAVGVTGGEPLLHPAIGEVLREGRQLGLMMHVNTNGSRVTRAHVLQLLEEQVHSLNISVDGGNARTHDELRGVPGSFDEIERTVREVLRQRGSRKTPRLGLVMALTQRNLGEVREFVALAKRWEVDGAGFLPHHPFVADQERLSGWEEADLRTALESLVGEVDNSPAYLERIPGFLAGEATPSNCSAPQSHVAIDPSGTRYPCVPLMTLGRAGVPWQDRGPLSTPVGAKDREEVCRRCWWNCHRELDLSLGLLRPALGSG